MSDSQCSPAAHAWQGNPYLFWDQTARIGGGMAMLAGLFQKSVQFASESSFVSRCFEGAFSQFSGNLLRGRFFSRLAWAAPIGMLVMTYNAARATGRLIDGTTEDASSDLTMIGGALCGIVGSMGSFNPLLRGVSSLGGLVCDGVDLSRLGCRWSEDEVSTTDIILQAGLTTIFGLDRESRQALKGLLPTRLRLLRHAGHENHIYSQSRFKPETDRDGIVAQPHDHSLTAVVREGVIDLRQIRLIHCLAEGDGADIIGRKLYDMRKILEKAKRENPFGWKNQGRKIMEEMTSGDSYSDTGRIQVARYLAPEGVESADLLLVNGQRRVATLVLLAARGDIPISWLREIPVHVHLISRAQHIREITSGRYLSQDEVFSEVLAAPKPYWWDEELPAWLKKRPRLFAFLEGKRRTKLVLNAKGSAVQKKLCEIGVGRKRSPVEALAPLQRLANIDFRQERPWLNVTNWQMEEAAIIFRLVRDGIIPERDFFDVMGRDPIFSTRVFDESRLEAFENNGWFSRIVEDRLTNTSPGQSAAQQMEELVRPLWLEQPAEIRNYLKKFVQRDSFYPETLREIMESGLAHAVFTRDFPMDQFTSKTEPHLREAVVTLSVFQPIRERVYFLTRLMDHEKDPMVRQRVIQALKATTVEAARTPIKLWATSKKVTKFWDKISRIFEASSEDPNIKRGWATMARWLYVNAAATHGGTLGPGDSVYLQRPSATLWMRPIPTKPPV